MFAMIGKETDGWDGFTVDEQGNSRFPVSGTKDRSYLRVRTEGERKKRKMDSRA